ncbi:MAG: DUF3108 domain-containing protein [bacterium]|jgi:hypothetical protein
MSRWANVDRRALARRIVWAGMLSALVHAVVLAVVELPDFDPMPRADWPQVDVRFASLRPEAATQKPAADAAPPAALTPELFDAAAAPQRKAAAEKGTAKARAITTPVAAKAAQAQPRIIQAEHVPVPPGPDGDVSASSSAAMDAASTAPSRAAQEVARAFPRALELEYSVLEAEGQTVLGWLVYRFERDGEHYRIRTVIDAIGIASFFIKGRYLQRSEGRLTAGGFQPETFMVRRGRRERVERAHFDWQALRVTLINEKGSREVALQAGAQDQLSALHQIAFLMESGAPPALQVTNGRRMETARIEVLGRETVTTELGPMATVRVRSDLGGGVVVQLWLAPDYGYLPARLRLRDKRGREAEQVLASMKVKW